MRYREYDQRRGPVPLEAVAAAAGLILIAVAAAFGWQLGNRAGQKEALAKQASLTGQSRPDGANQAASAATAAENQPAGDEATAGAHRLLFIGNSHSAHLPGALRALGRALGTTIETEQLTPGGARLVEHAAKGETYQTIRRRRCDFVILQEQSVVPGVPELRQTEMLPALRKLTSVIRQTGAKPLLFITWAAEKGDQHNRQLYPLDTYHKMQARVIEGYQEAARDTGAGLVPVGAAWRTVLRERSDIKLFAPDGVHASPAGIHLAAAVFLASLFQQDPSKVNESKAPEVPGLTGEQLRYLRQVAKNTAESY